MPARIFSLALSAAAVVGVAILSSSRGLRADDPMMAPMAPKVVKAELNAEALHALTSASVPFTLLDARGEAPEWIPGAKPCAVGASDDEVRRLCPSKSGLIVTYCSGAGCNMSLSLANRLLKDGYENVVRFTAGVAGWTAAGFDVKHPAMSDKPSMPGESMPGGTMPGGTMPGGAMPHGGGK